VEPVPDVTQLVIFATNSRFEAVSNFSLAIFINISGINSFKICFIAVNLNREIIKRVTVLKLNTNPNILIWLTYLFNTGIISWI